MDIQILREFNDLSYTLNFKKTADRMFIGQSTLSKHIISLEQELMVQLFVRTKHGVSLTAAGRDFLIPVKRILQEYDEALTLLQKGKDKLSGQLRIGFIDIAARKFLTESIRLYRHHYPDMKISLTSLQVGDLAAAFKSNAIDIAFTVLFPNSFLPPDTSFKSLYTDSISAVLPDDHPLLLKEHLFLDDLFRFPISLPSPQQFPSYERLIRPHVARSSIRENIIFEYSDIETALIMVESGLAVSILPSRLLHHSTTARFRDIEDFCPELRIGVMWKKENHAIGIQEYIDILSGVTIAEP